MAPLRNAKQLEPSSSENMYVYNSQHTTPPPPFLSSPGNIEYGGEKCFEGQQTSNLFYIIGLLWMLILMGEAGHSDAHDSPLREEWSSPFHR